MSTKICTKCQTSKPIGEFRFQNKSLDIYQRWCKSCAKTLEKSTYHNNSEHRAKRSAEKAVRIARNRDFFLNFMSNKKCEDCGDNDHRVLECHHIDPKTKRSNISDMWHNSHSIETIQAELDKCQILCVRCHRIKTFESRSASATQSESGD